MPIKLNGRELKRVYTFGFTGPSGFGITYHVSAGSEEEELTYIGQETAGQKWCSFEIETDEYKFSTTKCRLLRYSVEPRGDSQFDLVSVGFAIYIGRGVQPQDLKGSL